MPDPRERGDPTEHSSEKVAERKKRKEPGQVHQGSSGGPELSAVQTGSAALKVHAPQSLVCKGLNGCQPLLALEKNSTSRRSHKTPVPYMRAVRSELTDHTC